MCTVPRHYGLVDVECFKEEDVLCPRGAFNPNIIMIIITFTYNNHMLNFPIKTEI